MANHKVILKGKNFNHIVKFNRDGETTHCSIRTVSKDGKGKEFKTTDKAKRYYKDEECAIAGRKYAFIKTLGQHTFAGHVLDVVMNKYQSLNSFLGGK